MKQWLMENKSGMYSKSLNEVALLDAETLAKEIAKQHPELIRFKLDGETRKFQDAIFSYAGEILQDAGIPLGTVRGLAYDADWAMDLVSNVGSALEHDELDEANPAALGAPQAAADARMQQQDDENGDMVDNVSMGTVAEATSKHTTVALEEEPFFILGREYLVSGEVDVTVVSDYGETVIDDAQIEVKEMHAENGNEYVEVKDPVKLKMLEDLLNSDKELQFKLKDAVANKGFGDASDDYEDYTGEEDLEETPNEQIGVGYVSKVKSPEAKFKFPE